MRGLIWMVAGAVALCIVLNPKSPDELKEEEEEREFLNGGQSDEHKQHEHH